MGFWEERMYQKYLKLNSDVNVISLGICLNFTKNCTKTPKYHNLVKIWVLDSLQGYITLYYFNCLIIFEPLNFNKL